MRHRVGRFAALVLAPVAAVLAASAPARADDAADVRQVLEKFDKAYTAKDAEAIAALVSHEPDVVFYGPDVGDRWIGWAAVKTGYSTEFKRLKSATVEPQPANVHVRGDLAWFEQVLVMSLVVSEGEMSLFSRWTGVLEKKGGQWLFVQSHMSVGAPRESVPRD